MKEKLLRFFTKKRSGPPEAPPQPDCGQAVVIVPGVIESVLLLEKGTANEHPYYADGLRFAKKHWGSFLTGAVQALALHNCGRLIDFGEGLCEAFIGALFMRPDGSSVRSLRPVIETPRESAYGEICAAGKWKAVGYGARMAMELAQRVGGDNVFVFCYDWRRGVVHIAEDLAAFIAGVKAQTGGKTLSLCGCSYGCQVIAQYLYAGGKDAARIVFNAPAWRGTGLFRALQDPDKEKFYFNLPAAVRVLARFAKLEITPEPYVKWIPQFIVNEVAYAVVRRALDGGLKYAPGLWSCCAVEDYEEMKQKLLDPQKCAALIAQTDAAQYGVMRHIPQILAGAQAEGVGVWCIMNDGMPLMAGPETDTDGVIGAATGSGGVYLPVGQTAGGKRVSPSGRYDLTNALLPDKTWVIRGQVHGQSWWDDATRGLIADLLLTGAPTTVDADPARPQFTETRCPADGVSLGFGNGADCILRPAQGEITGVIRNDSRRKRVHILSASAQGLGYRAAAAGGVLRPGQSTPLRLIPTGEGGRQACGTVSVRFIKWDPLPLIHTRVFALRIDPEEKNSVKE